MQRADGEYNLNGVFDYLADVFNETDYEKHIEATTDYINDNDNNLCDNWFTDCYDEQLVRTVIESYLTVVASKQVEYDRNWSGTQYLAGVATSNAKIVRMFEAEIANRTKIALGRVKAILVASYESLDNHGGKLNVVYPISARFRTGDDELKRRIDGTDGVDNNPISDGIKSFTEGVGSFFKWTLVVLGLLAVATAVYYGTEVYENVK